MPLPPDSAIPARPSAIRTKTSSSRCSACGLDFVILHLECNAPDDVLQWADEVLDENASRRAIVTTHMGLGPLTRPKKSSDFRDAPKGRMQCSKVHGLRASSPQQMWDKCFRKHEGTKLQSDVSQHQFTLKYDMGGSRPSIGTDSSPRKQGLIFR